MVGYWINSKGKKFIGDAGIVPSADNKNPNVVSYEEWHALEMAVTTVDTASELNNGDIQELALVAEMSASGAPINEWGYDVVFSVLGINGAEIIDVVQNGLGATATLVLPAGIVEGDEAVVTVMSGGRKGTLTVTVEA